MSAVHLTYVVRRGKVCVMHPLFNVSARNNALVVTVRAIQSGVPLTLKTSLIVIIEGASVLTHGTREGKFNEKAIMRKKLM